MSYRPRRGRSRTPVRFRAEPSPSFRSQRSPANLKRSRDREEPKRERWEAERNRPRGRSRSPRRISSSRGSRDLFEPPQDYIPPKRSRSNERRKYIDLERPWTQEEERTTKFSPPTRFSPAPLLQFPVEPVIDPIPNQRWSSDDLRNTLNYSAAPYVENQDLSTRNQPVTIVISDELPDKKDNNQESSIPEFNPETSKLSSQEWIKLIETTAKERDWKQDEKLYVLTSRLAGYARQWHLNTGIKCKNWGELKQAFFTAFPSENDYYMLLKKMIGRMKEERETLTTYFHHKVALLNACDITGRKAVSCIVGGLTNSNLKEECKWQNFDDPDLLYQFLRSSGDSPVDAPKKIPVEEKKSLKKNQICFYCKKKGHLVIDCELKHKHMNSQYSDPPKPRGGAPGNNQEPSHPRNFGQKASHNKYFTEVAINGIPIKGFVDQSSDCTTIREESAHYLKLSYNKHYKMVKGFGGHPVSVIGVLDVPICVDRAIANVKLYVVSDHSQAMPIIVGQSFTEQPHVVVMKDGDKVRFYQRLENGQANFDF